MRADVRRSSPAGKVVMVTGAGRGLGAATATELARRGAVVACADIDGAAAERVAATLPGGRSRSWACDVTQPESVAEVVAATVAEFGSLDVVVANAGVLGRPATFRALSPAEIADVLAVNVGGAVTTVSAALGPVIESRGQVVLVGSVFAYVNGAGVVPYAMSKAAVEALGRGLRVELAGHGVSVLTASFSLIETDMIHQHVDGDRRALDLLAAVSPRVLLRRIDAPTAATAIADALGRRRTAVTVPARWRPVAAARGVLGPVLDRRLARSPAVRDALARLSDR
ncbi:SDR family NAD(P)-dependent oxidoreductase [Actinomycetospora atypica]|uniref:SDR family NAD(P)-dependent oxidoreductase n=1 Tax=Actinomycetospora atypica TaxID=1290095 RepID=A0ABV9YMT5_9PSEU